MATRCISPTTTAEAIKCQQVKAVVIKAKYENGVFKPMKAVPVKEGTLADVYLRGEGNGTKRKKSVKDYAAYGMWKDRTDIGDGVEHVNRMRRPRQKRSE
jgi:predicted DNA-binding antitoxin AbrB/MazE fold protein